MSRWYGVDLDGTLAHSDRDYDNNEVGEPIAPMVSRVKKWLSQGKDVRIFTARAHDKSSLQPVRDWSRKHLGRELPITNVKDPDMIELWDDRAVGVHRNRGEPVGGDPEHGMERLKSDLQKIAR